MRRAWLSALLVFGCTDFEPIEDGVCGNLVLDVDEDCDGFSAFENAACGDPATETENACFYVCDPAQELACPGGFVCGEDSRCRRPSGEFEPAPGSPWAFPVQDFAVGDVDGDGNADLVGSDLSRVTVRFGSSEAEFPTEYQTTIRRPEGPLTFGKFNADELLDVIIPIETGLFALLGDETRTLEPVAYSPFGAGNAEFRIRAVEGIPDNLVSELLIIDGVTHELRSLGDTPGTGQALPDGRVFADLTPRPPVAQVDGDDESEVALAFAGDRQVFVYGMEAKVLGEGFNVEPHQTVNVNGGAISRGAMFADVDGDGDKDLMVSLTPDAGARDQVAVAYNTAGVFGDAAVESVFNIAGPRWPLVAANLTPTTPRDDFVYPHAVMITSEGSGGPPADLFPSLVAIEAAWEDAAAGDFNGDGVLDVAVASPEVDSILVHLSTAVGLFNTFRVEVEGLPKTRPRSLQSGDVDGDFISDIAFARAGEDSHDELAVIFGSPQGGFEPPVSMGRLGQIDAVVPLIGFNSLGIADLIVDVLVVSTFPETETRALAVLEGSSSRRMISPFTLDPGDGEGAHVPRRSVIGDFSSPSDGVRDIIAIAEPPVNFADNAQQEDEGVVRNPSVWLIPGLDGDGSLDANATQFSELAEVLDQDAVSFEVRCSTWAVGDLDGFGGDELVGLDRSHGCPGSLLGSAEEEAAMLIVSTAEEGLEVAPVPIDPAASGSDELLLHDLDADDDLDLLALFRGGRAGGDGNDGGSADAPAVTVFWNDAGDLHGDAFSTLEIPDASEMFMVQPIQLDEESHPELVILTEVGLYKVHFNEETHQYESPVLYRADESGRTFGVGDVNGDGLEDVAFLRGEEVEILLQRPAEPLGAAAPEKGGGA